MDPEFAFVMLGFGLGAFFSLMGSSMSIEDPFRAPQHEVTTNKPQQPEHTLTTRCKADTRRIDNCRG